LLLKGIHELLILPNCVVPGKTMHTFYCFLSRSLINLIAMSVRILSLKKSAEPNANPYLAIECFEWVNERIKVNGVTDRAEIYDWLNNFNGEAYIIDNEGDKYYLIPAISPDGIKYVKTNSSEKKQDILFQLPELARL